MHRHTGHASGFMVWGGIGFPCYNPLVRIAGSLNSQLYISEVLEPVVFPYIQRLPSAIFQQDNAQLHVACNVQEYFFSRSISNRKTVVHACTTTGPTYTTRCYNRWSLAKCRSCMDCCTPRLHPELL
ncbi:uncharacterized protein TNCV_263001 [Trichonephila clavipes]|nr:uncharacterized protein TNCV_263001 [Trichonephila clavipes]